MAKSAIHEHHEQTFERIEKAEGWVVKAAAVVAAIVGVAMAIGLATATGYVTW